MKFLKVGRVAIITRGRYAGKKVSDTSDQTSWVEAAAPGRRRVVG